MPAKVSKQKRGKNRNHSNNRKAKKANNTPKYNKSKTKKNQNHSSQNLENDKKETKKETFIKSDKQNTINVKDVNDVNDVNEANGTHETKENNEKNEIAQKELLKQKREERQRRRLHSCMMAEEYLRKSNFEMARYYFEQSLNRKSDLGILPHLPNEMDIHCKLLICRMHCGNSKENVSKAILECDYILSVMPNSVQHHIIKAELLVRCNQFDQVGSFLVNAAQLDQPQIKDSVSLYFHQIAQNTIESNELSSDDVYYLENGNKENGNENKDECQLFDQLTLISQQNILSIDWSEVIECIDSEICDSILNELFPKNFAKQNKLKSFLKETLLWNLPQNDKQQSLIFLKVEFAYILARTLWEKLPLPMPKPEEKCTKTMEEAIAIDCESTYFLENGLFGCRDGYDFVSAALFEPSACLSQIFELVNEKKIVINDKWTNANGVTMLRWLSQTPLYHMSELINDKSDGNESSQSEWIAFMQTRINAHYAIDPELNENVLSRDAHEDGKKFEEAIEKIVGTEKKKKLMQLELDLSIPILKKYAKIMSSISGIDQDILIYELTLPEDEENEEKSSLLEEYLNNPKFKDYKAVGLPVLVQNAKFDVLSDESSYDRKQILYELSLLEKEVVQFQIDYRKEVYTVAGDKSNELDKVMSTLQYRGLELTKWLRNFVKYMIARRDIEEEIVNVSQKKSHQEAMDWFESMTNYLNGANNILLKIVSKLFMCNLRNAYNKYNHEKPIQESKENKENTETIQAKYEKYELNPGKKIEKISSRYFELDSMVKFYLTFQKVFKEEMYPTKFENLEKVKMFLKSNILENEKIKEAKSTLLSSLNMSGICIPILEVDIAGSIIENHIHQYIQYPQLERTKLFVERCRCLRDHIVCLIYSSVDQRCLAYATLHNSASKYFKCIECQIVYGRLLCNDCNLMHYCSTECQVNHWQKVHKEQCKRYAQLSSPTCVIKYK